MQLSHTPAATAAVFDDPNLIGSSGLVPILRLAEAAGLSALADQHLSLAGDKGANAGAKVSSLVAGMVAGADSLDDMAILRHGGMGRLFERCYAPSTLGSFLRTFTFGHVRQLDGIASRFLTALAVATPVTAGVGQLAVVDIDDTIIEVHGYAKQGAGFGYTGVRGLNALVATVSTQSCAPVIVAQRLRKGSANSARGASRLVRDALKTVRTLAQDETRPGRVGCCFEPTPPTTGTPSSVPRSRPGRRSRSPSASMPASRPRSAASATMRGPRSSTRGRSLTKRPAPGCPTRRLPRRRRASRCPAGLSCGVSPDANAEKKKRAGQHGLFEVWRHHAFFTTTLADLADTVTADKVHRAHAVIEQVHADLKSSALAHLPSGKFTANAAWLVLAVMAFNLTRAAAALTGARRLARATTATLRRTLVHVPARVATSARRLTLHLPRAWPWQYAWAALFERVHAPPLPATT